MANRENALRELLERKLAEYKALVRRADEEARLRTGALVAELERQLGRCNSWSMGNERCDCFRPSTAGSQSSGAEPVPVLTPINARRLPAAASAFKQRAHGATPARRHLRGSCRSVGAALYKSVHRPRHASQVQGRLVTPQKWHLPRVRYAAETTRMVWLRTDRVTHGEARGRPLHNTRRSCSAVSAPRSLAGARRPFCFREYEQGFPELNLVRCLADASRLAIERGAGARPRK